jgi:hypothetical protein
VQIRRRSAQICPGATERDVTVGTHQVLAGVLDAKSRQRLTIVINERSLGVLPGQMSDHQQARESVLKRRQAILLPCGEWAAEQ